MKIQKPILLLERVDLFVFKEALEYHQKNSAAIADDAFQDHIDALNEVVQERMEVSYVVDAHE